MRQKLSILFVLFIFIGITNIQSQNMGLKADPRLKEVFNYEKIKQLEENGSFKLAVYNYYLDNMYYLSDVVPQDAINVGSIYNLERMNSYATFQENIDVFDNKTFNPYLYQFNIPYNEITYYVIEEGKKYLVIYSREMYDSNLQHYLKEQHIVVQ